MNYSNKKIDWLRNRLTKIYSVQIPEQYYNDITTISLELNKLDYQRLANYGIDFNHIPDADKIAKILELNYDDVKENQIKNIAQQYSETDLRTAIVNLPENTNPNEIIIERIKQFILSNHYSWNNSEVKMDDLPIINYLKTVIISEYNSYL